MDVLQGVERQRRRARLVVWLLGASAALSVVAIASGAAQDPLLDRAADGGVADAELVAGEVRQGLIVLLRLVALVATAIAWCRWAHRAHANLALMGVGRTDHSPAAAVYSWFIPISNLVRPYQITKELWFRSRDANAAAHVAGQEAPGLVAAWWGAWIVASLLGQFGGRASPTASGTALAAAADLAQVAAAILAIRIVRQIDAWQRSGAIGAHAVAALS